MWRMEEDGGGLWRMMENVKDYGGCQDGGR